MSISAPRGTKDILAEESIKWQYLEEKAKGIFSKYNYQEIRTPIFEETALFKRGIGETTDIVEKEMYTFLDKKGRSMTLRPEGTAGVVRAFLENKIYGQAQPTKYFYMGSMFRYERPQAGRYREFHQLGVEVLGANNCAIDVEVIAMGMNFLEELGLRELELNLNSVGCPNCREEYKKKLMDYFKNHLEELCSDCQSRYNRNPLRILDCKKDNKKEFFLNAPKIYEELCRECNEHFEGVKEYLDVLNIEYIINPRLVRGLDYYTKTAFEVIYKGLGAQDTIFAGGRYDGLVGEIGGKDVPGVGFAMGMERILLTLEEQGTGLPIDSSIDLFIVSMGSNAEKVAFRYLQQLRSVGLKAEMDYLSRGVKAQMKAADRNNANYTIILGDDELLKGVATIKHMVSGEQVEIKLENLVEEMEKRID